MGVGRCRTMEQTNGAQVQMEAPFAAHPQRWASLQVEGSYPADP